MSDNWAPWISGAAIVIAAIAAGLFAWINRKGGERARREPTWNELVTENRALRVELSEFRKETEERFDKLDREVVAMKEVISTFADKWPDGHPIPEFRPEVLAELGDTLPPKLRVRKNRPATA